MIMASTCKTDPYLVMPIPKEQDTSLPSLQGRDKEGGGFILISRYTVSLIATCKCIFLFVFYLYFDLYFLFYIKNAVHIRKMK